MRAFAWPDDAYACSALTAAACLLLDEDGPLSAPSPRRHCWCPPACASCLPPCLPALTCVHAPSRLSLVPLLAACSACLPLADHDGFRIHHPRRHKHSLLLPRSAPLLQVLVVHASGIVLLLVLLALAVLLVVVVALLALLVFAVLVVLLLLLLLVHVEVWLEGPATGHHLC